MQRAGFLWITFFFSGLFSFMLMCVSIANLHWVTVRYTLTKSMKFQSSKMPTPVPSLPSAVLLSLQQCPHWLSWPCPLSDVSMADIVLFSHSFSCSLLLSFFHPLRRYSLQYCSWRDIMHITVSPFGTHSLSKFSPTILVRVVPSLAWMALLLFVERFLPWIIL